MNPFSILGAKIFAGTSLALLIALGLTFAWGKAGWRDAHSYKLAAETLKASYIAAQEAATAEAMAAKLTTEAAYRAKAEKTDAEYQTALDRARSASDAYASRMRVGRIAGPSSQTPSPADNRGPQEPDRPRADAVLVSRNDFDILVENSVRLEAAHDWALTLNLAVPDPSFGK